MPKLNENLPKGRPKNRHGGYSFLTKGTIPENRSYVLRYLTAARQGLIEDIGSSEENLTASQIILIDRTISLIGVCRLIEEYAKEHGIFIGSKLTPSLQKNFISYNNAIRLNLQALGISRGEGEKVLSPLQLAAELDAEKSQSD